MATSVDTGARSASATIRAIRSRFIVELQPHPDAVISALRAGFASPNDRIELFRVGGNQPFEVSLEPVPTTLAAPSLEVEGEHAWQRIPAPRGLL